MAASTRLRLRVSPGASSTALVGRSALKLVSGAASREKILELERIDEAGVVLRLVRSS